MNIKEKWLKSEAIINGKTERNLIFDLDARHQD
jgi:hypothetical protein